MISDIEIANKIELRPIADIAKDLGLDADDYELYGKYKAKICESAFKKNQNNKNGKLILVTAINPTPAGEGKTTVTIGLGQAINMLGKKAVIALREPSLGPVFGIKGGATGGGYSQALPMEDINLHFTGDMHAITSANNLLCAILDNHIHWGNSLNIDPRKILIKRCLDINERALRNIVVGLGGATNGIPREDGFVITVASEIMAILCLANDLEDLKARLGDILIAYTYDDNPIYARDLHAECAMAALMKDAINPNLVQSTENGPIIMHGGPFANIAHGCNSLRATKLALKLGDYCITEAGFGADLGAEKFLDIKCRKAGFIPNCIVIVATIRALKYNGGEKLENLNLENIDALEKGICNLGAHIKNMRKYGVPTVVTLNQFETDTEAEIAVIENFVRHMNCDFAVSKIHKSGGYGGTDLAKLVLKVCEHKSKFSPIYTLNSSIEHKIEKIAHEIYHAKSVKYSPQAQKSIKKIKMLGKENLPICIAKTQYSLSDNPEKLGAPQDFEINIKDIYISNGAGFLVALAGNILQMPGLPKVPAAENIDVNEFGKISGLF